MFKLLVLTTLTALVLAEIEPQPGDTEDTVEAVGCEAASPTSWSWQISLQYKSGSNFIHTCGGTLVRKDWVMTAAHCVNSPRTWRVVLGLHEFGSVGGGKQIKMVSGGFIHPRWDPSRVSNGYDIALLRLESEATLNSYVQLASLPPSGQILPHNSPCYMTGWRRTFVVGSSTVLRQAFLFLVDHQSCTRPDWWGSTVKTNMVCAGGPADCECISDSGGPLNCQVNGQYHVHGIASFVSAIGCNILKKPRIFTRVSAYIEWMDSIMN